MKAKRLILYTLLSLVGSSIAAQNSVQPAVPNETCQAAWAEYKKADALFKTGWGLFGVGIGVGIAGGIMLPIGAFGNSSSPSGNPQAKAMVYTSLAFLGAGGGMLIASIPCLTIGQTRR